MNIYLVRHGETDWNRNGILMGQADIPLNIKGKEQATKIANNLKDVEFDICYSSPLSRAKETAEIICQGKKIVEDNLLKERGSGIYSGKNKNQIDWDEYSKDNSVESCEALFERAKEFSKKLEYIDAENVLIVSHSGLLKNLLHILKNGDFETFDWNSYSDSFKNNCDFIVIKKILKFI